MTPDSVYAYRTDEGWRVSWFGTGIACGHLDLAADAPVADAMAAVQRAAVGLGALRVRWADDHCTPDECSGTVIH